MKRYFYLLLALFALLQTTLASEAEYLPLKSGNYWVYVSNDTIGAGCQSPQGLNGAGYFLPSSSSQVSSKTYSRVEIGDTAVMEGKTWYLRTSCDVSSKNQKCSNAGEWVRYEGTALVSSEQSKVLQDFVSTQKTYIDTLLGTSTGARGIYDAEITSKSPGWTSSVRNTVTIDENKNSIYSQNIQVDFWHAGVGLVYSYSSRQLYPDANPTYIVKKYLCQWSVGSPVSPTKGAQQHTGLSTNSLWNVFDFRGQALGHVRGDSYLQAQTKAQFQWPHRGVYLQAQSPRNASK